MGHNIRDSHHVRALPHVTISSVPIMILNPSLKERVQVNRSPTRSSRHRGVIAWKEILFRKRSFPSTHECSHCRYSRLSIILDSPQWKIRANIGLARGKHSAPFIPDT